MAVTDDGAVQPGATELTVGLGLPWRDSRLDRALLASLVTRELDGMLRDLRIDAGVRVEVDADERGHTTGERIGLLHLGDRSLPVTGLDGASAQRSAWQCAHVLHAHRRRWLPEAADAQLDAHLPAPGPESFGSAVRRLAHGVAPKLMKQIAPRPLTERRDVIAGALLQVAHRGVATDSLWTKLSISEPDPGETTDAAVLAERAMDAATARLGVHLAEPDLPSADAFEPLDLIDALWDGLGLIVAVDRPVADERTQSGEVRISINGVLLPPLPATPDSLAERIHTNAERLAEIHAGSLVNTAIVGFRLVALEAAFPAIVEVARRRWSVEHITCILRATLDDGLPIRDLRAILEAMLAIPPDQADGKCDPARVARDMRRHLSIAAVRRSVRDGGLPTYELAEAADAIVGTADRLIEVLEAAEARRPEKLRPVLLAPVSVADHVREAVRVPFPAVSVMAADEIPGVLRPQRLERLVLGRSESRP